MSIQFAIRKKTRYTTFTSNIVVIFMQILYSLLSAMRACIASAVREMLLATFTAVKIGYIYFNHKHMQINVIRI